MKTLGILREGYSKWERRSPLTPAQVARAIREHKIRVVVQPSTLRVFTNDEYAKAGATISDNLEDCTCIVGVKQVDINSIIAGKTYLFFSHTIKAQESNMKLLDRVLEKKVRLVDHECIRDLETGERLVAFGEYAGRAGMLESIRGLGIRLLGMGYSTPFLNVGPAYSYKSFDDAVKAAANACEDYVNGGGSTTFLPKGYGPLCFVFTGSGKVSRGAQEVFGSLTGSEMLDSIEDLTTKKRNTRAIYGICLRDVDVMQKIGDEKSTKVDRKDYLQNPQNYHANRFATNVLPHAHLVLTGAYWDARFPKWMPANDLVTRNSKQLLLVSDVSCDIHGTFDGLTRSTTIEDPFFYVDFQNQMKEVPKDLLKKTPALEREERLKLVLGVDILPSELPREASNHFGECLLPFVSQLCDPRGEVGPVLERATIAKDGQLTPQYSYIGKIRAERERSQRMSSMVKAEEEQNARMIKLEGHLFDTRLINRVLDLIENKQGKFRILQASLSQPRGGPGRELRAHTTVVLQVISGSGADALNTEGLLQAIERLVKEAPAEAEATLFRLEKDEAQVISQDLLQTQRSKKEPASFSTPSSLKRIGSRIVEEPDGEIVLLGAGMVCAPAAEYLLKHLKHRVRVVSAEPNELDRLRARFATNHAQLAFENSKVSESTLEGLLSKGSTAPKCILSLLPAPMHHMVAKFAVPKRIPLVTASYVGALREIHDQAEQAGVPILCEMGLDPGMDHMSCMKLINDGGGGDQLVSFESFCGGLPAPESANNPLGYKLSWSPRGVLTALLNRSTYISQGKRVQVDDIIEAGCKQPFTLSNFAYPALNLEWLPNRDATVYAEPYNVPIQRTQTFLRGTLRYRGFCEVMKDFRRNGWLDDTKSAADLRGKRWGDVCKKEQFGARAWAYLEPELQRSISTSGSRLDALCELFKQTLQIRPDVDRDLVLMEHRLHFRNGTSVTSSLVEFGNAKDTAMARTVGITAAIGVQLLLEGKHGGVGGIHLPTAEWVYQEALTRLEGEGIRFHENVVNSSESKL